MSISNLEKYRNDLDTLLTEASLVKSSLDLEAFGRSAYYEALVGSYTPEEAEAFVSKLKPFSSAYQRWYSEALPLVKQLLPDRSADFIRFYEKPKARKSIDFENYRIEDACQGLRITRGSEVKTDQRAAIPLLSQQVAIVRAIKRRFESSLFDIKQLVRADLYDSELDTARDLLKAGFSRAAGAVAGVVLEGHLKQVCENHKLPIKSGTISVLNDTLKAAASIDLPQSRHIQYLGDIRNKCGHKNATDPTASEVTDLIEGVEKVIKTIF
jgi:hypothetical protein